MNEDTTSTAESTGNDSIDTASNAFAALLTGEEPGNEEDSEALPEEGEEAEASEEVEEAPEDDETEPEYDEEQDEEETEAQAYTVKINGEEVTVPLDELLNGYSRTQDYTRKTQALAEERKAAQAEFEQVRAERTQYSQLLNQLQQQVEASTTAEPDWDRLRAEDPIEFGAQWADHQRKQQQAYAIRAEQGRLAEIQQREQVAHVQETLSRERELLVQVIPEWKNPEKATAEKAAILEFGQRVGFSKDELSQITDHRAVLALRKAYLYDKLMANKGQIKPVQKATAPVLRPGTAATAPKRTTQMARATQRLAKTGSVQDAASAFSLLLKG